MAAPLWFGPTERPLFGWAHLPEGNRARAGVVLCPPLGPEYNAAYATLRLLAEQLAAEGFVVLRIDYDGTGDSAGEEDDPDRLPAWEASVRHALGLLREAGLARLALVGMRFGSALAALAARSEGGVDCVVLWDPVYSGKSYLAEQRLLGASVFGESVRRQDGSLEVPGLVFGKETVEDLRSIDISAWVGEIAGNVLVLARSDRRDVIARRWPAGVTVEVVPARGQREMIEAGADYGAVNYLDSENIAAWLSARLPHRYSAFSLPASKPDAVVATASTGSRVVEKPLLLGEAGLFGVLTQSDNCRGDETLVLLLNVAHEPHHGPGRLWVSIARSLASNGLRCFRMDFSGLGDSPARKGCRGSLVRAPEAFDDVAEACAALQPKDPSNVVLVGFCTSGYQALDSAFHVKPRAVVAMSPETSFRPPEYDLGKPFDPRRRVALPRTAPISKYYRSRYGWPLGSPTRARVILGACLRSLAMPTHPLARRARESVRRLATITGWLAWSLRHPASRPSVWLPELLEQGTEVLLVCREQEFPTTLPGLGRRKLAKLSSQGHLRVVWVPEHGHAYFLSSRRNQLASDIAGYVVNLLSGEEPKQGSLAERSGLGTRPPGMALCHL
jgi:pimeloyl-ACP methyl ester carboxylesterase